MKNTLIAISMLLLGLSCIDQKQEGDELKFNAELASDLKQRAELDQIAAWIPEGKFKEYS